MILVTGAKLHAIVAVFVVQLVRIEVMKNLLQVHLVVVHLVLELHLYFWIEILYLSGAPAKQRTSTKDHQL